MKLSQELIAILAVGVTLTGLQITLFVSLRGEMSDLRGEMRGEMAELRGEMAGLRGATKLSLARQTFILLAALAAAMTPIYIALFTGAAA